MSKYSVLRGPLQVAYDITNKCNFRCLHCYNNSGENNFINSELSDEEVISLMHDLGKMKLENVCFCGGEPLLRKDLISIASKILNEYGIKSISLVTNGYLMNKEIAKDLIQSGVTNFQISLDGSSFKSHDFLRQKKGSFEKAVEAIKILKDSEAKNIDVAFSCTNFNLDELKSVYHICNELGVSRLRTQPLMIIGRATKNEEKIALSNLDYRKYIKYVYELKKEYDYDDRYETVIEFGDPVEHIISGYTEEPFNEMVNIKANGDISISPFIPLVVGNIRKNSLSEYWDAGLGEVWKLELAKTLAKNVVSPNDFGNKVRNMPNTWIDKDIYFDIIAEKMIKSI